MHDGAGDASVMRRSKSLSTLGAASLQDEPPVLGRHASPKTMSLRPASVVRLKRALRHRKDSPLKTKTLRLIFARSYVKKRATSQTAEEGPA